MSRARRRVVKNQVNVELEQIGAVPEDFLLNRVAMFGQNIHGPVKLVKPEILSFRQPHPLKPAFMTGELGTRPIGQYRLR